MARDHEPPFGSRLRGRRLLFARLVWVTLAALTLGMALSGFAIVVQRPELGGPTVVARAWAQAGIPLLVPIFGLLLPILLVFSATAFIVFWHGSDDWVRMLFALALLTIGAGEFVVALERAYPTLPGPGFVMNLEGALLVLVVFLFPDGRFVPKWTRLPVVVLLAPLAYLDFGGLLLRLPEFSTELPTWWVQATLLLTIALIALGLLAQVYRFRFVSGWVERQQTKWVLFSLAALFTYLLLGLALPSFFWEPAEWFGWVEVAGAVPLLLVPVSIAIAIMRYRLFDIDQIINRTLVYGALTAGVLAVYVLVVNYLSAVLSVEGNRLVSLAATGLVAVIFQPLRERLQLAVNRLMYGERDDPYSVLSRLGRRLEETLAPDAVLPTLVETVARTLRLPYVAIRLETSGDAPDTLGAAYPPAQAVEPPAQLIRLPIMYQRESLGTLELARRSPDEPLGVADGRLLEDLARQAGIAVRAVQLTADLKQARERLVTTREEERRRLRRDLHDGLGSQLAALHLQAGGLQKLIRRDPSGAEEQAAELRTELRSAIASIRQLVRQLRPPALDELGLLAALNQRAAQYSSGGERAADVGVGEVAALQVRVEAPDSLPPLPAAIEVAIYRIVDEALTNVLGHAHARTCAVRLRIDDEVKLEITDDGVGLPPSLRTGVGLLSMRERAAELGGVCRIEPSPEGGTRVAAQLPLSAPVT